MIRFVFKASIFIIIALVIISFFAPTSQNKDQQTNGINVFETLGAIRETIADLGNFCDRNSETCDTGKVVLNSIGDRVRDGAKVTYDYIGTKVTKDDTQNNQQNNTAAPAP